MKKLLLSAFVIGLFVIYGLHRQEEVANSQVTIPLGSSNPPSPTQSSGSSNPPAQSGQYKDGSYTGNAADAFYGNIQVQVTISGGKITDVQFLQYPSDRSTSVMINSQAMPYLKQEAIQAQSANVDIISGATDSSQAFQESMQSALAQAQ